MKLLIVCDLSNILSNQAHPEFYKMSSERAQSVCKLDKGVLESASSSAPRVNQTKMVQGSPYWWAKPAC